MMNKVALQEDLDVITTRMDGYDAGASSLVARMLSAEGVLESLQPVAFSGSFNDLVDKPVMGSAVADTVPGAAVDAATNAPIDAPVNLNPVTVLLGALVSEVNATNGRQNQIGTKYNDLATKYNTAAAKLNDGLTALNTCLARLRSYGVIAAA